MSVKTVSPKTQRWLKRAGLVAAAVAPFAVLNFILSLSPLFAVVAIAGVTCGLVAALTRYNRNESAGPAQWQLWVASMTVVAGAVWVAGTTFLALPLTFQPVLRGLLPVLTGLAVAAPAFALHRALRSSNPTAWAVTLVDAVDATWDKARRRFAVIVGVVAVITGGTAVAGVGGLQWLPVITVAAWAIPAALGWKAARARGNVRADIAADLCGRFTGGRWTKALEDAGTSPVVCTWHGSQEWPDEIALPLPPRWEASELEGVQASILTRLSVDGSPRGDISIRMVKRGRRKFLVVEVGLPAMVPHPGAVAGSRWDVIPVGLGENGLPVQVVLADTPHVLVAGPTGAGKSVVERAFLLHALIHKDDWRIVGIDLKQVELSFLTSYENVMRVAITLEDAVDVLRTARDDMTCRFTTMKDEHVNHFTRLKDRPPALMILVDEMFQLLVLEKDSSEEGKERDDLHKAGYTLLAEIGRLGRAAGVHIVGATQFPYADTLKGELKGNMDARIAAGRMDGGMSRMVLDNDTATNLPKVKGRGIIRLGGEQQRFQGYFVELGQGFDDLVRRGVPNRPAVAPSASPAPVGTTPVSDRDKVARPDVTSPTVTFTDVGGYEDVKALLRGAVGTLINDPGAAAKYGLTPSGVLLYGPPGTGKTLLAEATAGELGLQFCKVTTGNLTSRWINAGPELVIAMAETVIAAAPCLLFIDEFDGVAPRRDGGHAEDNKVVTELLRQLDRLREVPGVVVMAATNRIEALDPAAIRPGRMDTRIRVDLPDRAAREAILRASLAGRPLVANMDLAPVVEATDGATGAILAAIVNTAAGAALKAAQPITAQDILTAIKVRGGNDRPTVEAAGLDQLVLDPKARATITQLLSLLKNPAQAAKLGIKQPTGAVLYGPPGTGKTSLARAIAAEAGCSFYPVKGSDFVQKYYGEGDRALEQLYERARASKPSIIFIDEIDGLSGARNDEVGDGGGAVTTLQSLLDGFESNAGVFTIGATNRIETLDDALVRGGRLSHAIEIGLPDQDGREALMVLFTKTMPVDGDVDLNAVANLLEGFSPSNIEGMVQKAGMSALNRAATTGVPVKTVTAADFATALEILPNAVTCTDVPVPVLVGANDGGMDGDEWNF